MHLKRGYWRGLLAAVAVGLATRAFGLLGALVIGSVMAAVWRWPKVQAISAGTLSMVLFVLLVLFYPSSPPPPRAASAVASETSQLPQTGVPSRTDNTGASPSATASAQWAEASGAFIAVHHDLNQSQNLNVMQEKLDTIYAPTLTYPELLEQAYQAAKRDSRWVDTSQSGVDYSMGASFPTRQIQVAANSPAYIQNQDTHRTQQQISYPNTPHNNYCWHHYYQIIDRLPNDMGLGNYVNTRDKYLKKMHECLRR